MFDEMTITKAAGGFLAGFLVLLLGSWAASSIYDISHHGDDHAMGYLIETGDDGAEEEEVVEVPFAELYAAADAGAGEKLWRQCGSCHKLEAGKNATGPYLHGVVNRPKAAAEGYSYSAALSGMGGEWTPENIANFIANPKGYAPGTAMSYSFRGDRADAADLVAYLATTN